MKKGLSALAGDLKAIEEHHSKVAFDRLFFAMKLQRFLDELGHRALGYKKPWAYLDGEVLPALGWSRGKLARHLMAAREANRVVPLRREGARAPSVNAMAMLHTERRLQERRAGRVGVARFRAIERQVANGISLRALRCALAPAA